MPARVTPEAIRTAVARPDVRTMADLCRALGVFPGGGNYGLIRDVARRAQIVVPESSRRARLPTEEEGRLADLVAGARSHSEVLRALGRRPDGRDWYRYKASLAALAIEATHLGAGWKRGGVRPPTEAEREAFLRRATTGEVGRGGLGQRLIRYGIKEARCEGCERTEWRGEAIPLELDHIDGDRFNNRLDNLRLLCPNCHALTPTYRGRNMGTRAYANRPSGPA